MKNSIKTIVLALLLLSLGASYASADVKKGQKLYLKKLKGSCGFNGAIMAAKHSMGEWEHLQKNNQLAQEIQKFCPKVKDRALKKKFMPHYYDFFHNFASDSGNIPSC